MSVLGDLRMYGRFAWGLRGFLRHTITLEEAKAIVRKRLAEREENFLRLVEKGVYGYPRSPYLPLLRLAQVELGDIQNMVRDKGLEDTLQALREAGVYVTFEEFKGREPIEREGQVIAVRAQDFDNPYLRHYYEGESGGSTGAGTRVAIDLEHVYAQAPHMMLAREAHGLRNVPRAIWLGVLPDGSGLASVLRGLSIGEETARWFYPGVSQDSSSELRNRLAMWYIVTAGRLSGIPIPWPEPVPLDQAATVARWMAETLKVHGSCLLTGHVSKALRVCVAAEEAGIDLARATFWGGGEPPTPAKVRRITQAGARWVPGYYISEAGVVGQGCARPADTNDIHLFRDAFALIQRPRHVPGLDISVQALYFTSLLPTTPKLMLNAESDDYGLIESRRCGCLLESAGFTQHVRHIHSFRKLTGEGVTLVGSEMIRILEEVLPARFGGSPLDYQLLEEEDERGFTRVSLLVSPKIEITDEASVIDVVLESLNQGSVSAALAQATWCQAETLRVKRMNPILTSRGKLLPLHSMTNPTSSYASAGLSSARAPVYRGRSAAEEVEEG